MALKRYILREVFQDYLNDNYIEIGVGSKNQYVSFYSEDLKSDESVQINLSLENVRSLIEFLNTVCEIKE